MLHHVKAVTNAKPSSLVVADMPYMSYHVSKEDTIKNAGRFIQEGKADAVKIEGGKKREENAFKLCIRGRNTRNGPSWSNSSIKESYGWV